MVCVIEWCMWGECFLWCRELEEDALPHCQLWPCRNGATGRVYCQAVLVDHFEESVHSTKE